MKAKILNTFTVVGLSLASSIAMAAVESPWLVRVRAIDVIPDVSSSRISMIGGHVSDVGNNVTPELDFSYFFNPHFAAELILASSRHHPKATNTVLGNVDLGSVRTLPPTLTLQYHPLIPQLFDPYIGAGVNFTHFFDVNPGPVATSIHYENTVGPALQVGTDIHLNDQWVFNIDAKKVYMRPDVHVNTVLGTLKTKVRLDPWIVGVGIGYHIS